MSADAWPHVVYRCYGPDDYLLYIGCTYSPARRMSSHRNSRNTVSRWLQACMVRYEVSEAYPTRTAALAAESAAIHDEHPLFNIQHTKGVGVAPSKRATAEYLIVAGYRDLAVETACECWSDREGISAPYDSWCGVHGHLVDERVSA